MATKQCTKCGEVKELGEFYRDKAKQDGYRPDCRDCTRNCQVNTRRANPELNKQRCRKWREINIEYARSREREYAASVPAITKQAKMLRFNYGITLEQYKLLFDAQLHVCAICKQPESAIANGGKIKQLSVDHDHNTGVIRGLLCTNCNHAIGNFRDDPALLIAAVAYLQQPPAAVVAPCFVAGFEPLEKLAFVAL